jgi:DNA-binding transcriptional LysR family regulator
MRTLPKPAAKPLPFDLRDLQIFLAVCEHGGMGAAAKLFSLTQPAVSQSIADLEAGLGAKLFDRAVRPLGLTPSGGLLRQRALALLANAHQIVPAIREAQRSHLSLVRLGIADSLSRALTSTVTAFLSTRAKEVSVVSGFTAMHAEGIISRSLEILIGVDALEDIGWAERHALIDEPFIVLLPRRINWNLESLADLHNQPLIRYSEHSQTGRDIERYLRRLRLEIPRFQEFDNPTDLSAAVAAGHGWAITTALCAYEGGLDRRIRCAPLPAPGMSRRLYMICRKGELGRLPADLTDVIKTELSKRAVPAIVSAMPWLGDRLRISGGTS